MKNLVMYLSFRIINFCTVLWDHWMKGTIYDHVVLPTHEVNLFETEYFFNVVKQLQPANIYFTRNDIFSMKR